MERTEGHKQHRLMLFIELSTLNHNQLECDDCHTPALNLVEIDQPGGFRVCLECFVNS